MSGSGSCASRSLTWNSEVSMWDPSACRASTRMVNTGPGTTFGDSHGELLLARRSGPPGSSIRRGSPGLSRAVGLRHGDNDHVVARVARPPAVHVRRPFSNDAFSPRRKVSGHAQSSVALLLSRSAAGTAGRTPCQRPGRWLSGQQPKRRRRTGAVAVRPGLPAGRDGGQESGGFYAPPRPSSSSSRISAGPRRGARPAGRPRRPAVLVRVRRTAASE